MFQKLFLTLVTFAISTMALDTPTTPQISIEILKPGTGPLVPNFSEVKCHYILNLENGTKVDSSRDRGQPFEFRVGQGKVIAGWEQAIIQMKKGERSMITIPSELGYGARGAGRAIPPNATLKFDVEIIDYTPGQ